MAKANKFGYGAINNVEEGKGGEMVGDDGELRIFFDGLEDAVHMDKKHMLQMTNTNSTLVNLTQQLTNQFAASHKTVETVLKQNQEWLSLLAKHRITATGTMAAAGTMVNIIKRTKKKAEERRGCV